MPAAEDANRTDTVGLTEGDEGQGQGDHRKRFDKDRYLTVEDDLLFNHAVRRPSQADDKGQPGNDAVDEKGQGQSKACHDNGKPLYGPQFLPKEDASKEYEDDGIDKIGQTCLQNEAPRRRINVRTPIKSKGGLMIGTHNYRGVLGDVDVDSANIRATGVNVNSTTLGTNSYNCLLYTSPSPRD